MNAYHAKPCGLQDQNTQTLPSHAKKKKKKPASPKAKTAKLTENFLFISCCVVFPYFCCFVPLALSKRRNNPMKLPIPLLLCTSFGLRLRFSCFTTHYNNCIETFAVLQLLLSMQYLNVNKSLEEENCIKVFKIQ